MNEKINSPRNNEDNPQATETRWEELAEISQSANNSREKDAAPLGKAETAGYKVGPEYDTPFFEWEEGMEKKEEYDKDFDIDLFFNRYPRPPKYERLIFESLPQEAQKLSEDKVREIIDRIGMTSNVRGLGCNDDVRGYCIKIPGHDEWATGISAVRLCEEERTRFKTAAGRALLEIERGRLCKAASLDGDPKPILDFVKSACHGTFELYPGECKWNSEEETSYRWFEERVCQNIADGCYRQRAALVKEGKEQWFSDSERRLRGERSERYKKMFLINDITNYWHSIQKDPKFIEKWNNLDEQVRKKLDIAILVIYKLAEGDFEAENLVHNIRCNVYDGGYDDQHIDGGGQHFTFLSEQR